MAPLNLPASMPFHASLLFSRNLTAFLQAFTKDGAFQLDLNDDIQQGALITHAGEVRHARTREALAEGGSMTPRAAAERWHAISGASSSSSCSPRSSGWA